MKPASEPVGLPGQDPPNDQQIDAAVLLFALLADDTRLRLLWALTVREYDVKTLTRIAGSSKTSTSQHLARLRDAELVNVRREGRRAIYKANGGHIRKLIREALHQADHQLSAIPPHT